MTKKVFQTKVSIFEDQEIKERTDCYRTDKVQNYVIFKFLVKVRISSSMLPRFTVKGFHICSYEASNKRNCTIIWNVGFIYVFWSDGCLNHLHSMIKYPIEMRLYNPTPHTYSGGDPLRLNDVKVTSTRWPGPARKMYRHWREWFVGLASIGALKVPLEGPPLRDTNVWSHSVKAQKNEREREKKRETERKMISEKVHLVLSAHSGWSHKGQDSERE